jgi:hypothetical protein
MSASQVRHRNAPFQQKFEKQKTQQKQTFAPPVPDRRARRTVQTTTEDRPRINYSENEREEESSVFGGIPHRAGVLARLPTKRQGIATRRVEPFGQ